MSDLVGNPKDEFSRVAAHITCKWRILSTFIENFPLSKFTNNFPHQKGNGAHSLKKKIPGLLKSILCTYNIIH